MSSPDLGAPDLSALVAARLCHDLISPIGAIGNGLELLELAGAGAGAELALVNESVATALAKLRFYRIAFGPADAQARQSLDEAAQITGAMFSGRFSVAWEAGPADLPRTAMRLAYLAILCLERSLPMGGRATVSVGDGRITLAVAGRRTAPPAELWAHVLEGARLAEVKADAVQFALLRQGLATSGYRLAASFGDDAAEIGLAAPAAMLAEARP
jgi:histidine phosphotransferase ChpT